MKGRIQQTPDQLFYSTAGLNFSFMEDTCPCREDAIMTKYDLHLTSYRIMGKQIVLQSQLYKCIFRLIKA